MNIISKKRDNKIVSRPVQKYPPQDVIAIDVDGTLIIDGEVNTELVAWCRARKADGYELILWSARGVDNCYEAIEISNTYDLFDHILSKPGYTVDDNGWAWTNFSRVINDLEASL